jgi:hypothetical protein
MHPQVLMPHLCRSVRRWMVVIRQTVVRINVLPPLKLNREFLGYEYCPLIRQIFHCARDIGTYLSSWFIRGLHHAVRVSFTSFYANICSYVDPCCKKRTHLQKHTRLVDLEYIHWKFPIAGVSLSDVCELARRAGRQPMKEGTG